jgi:D-tyrosyl-tRNA(Tyr) deacylase
MRTCIQRVSTASVSLKGTDKQHQIGAGLLVLLGIGQSDTEKEAAFLAKKCCELRIFEDDAGKMNRSLFDIGGKMLVVSQFTLYADCRKGRRPSFTEAAAPEVAEKLYQYFCGEVRKRGIEVAAGFFRQDMSVALVNDGPVTVWIDTKD